MKKKPVMLICGILTMGLTVYILLDTFVIKDVYKTDAGVQNKDIVFASTMDTVSSDSSDTKAHDKKPISRPGDHSLSKNGASSKKKGPAGSHPNSSRQGRGKKSSSVSGQNISSSDDGTISVGDGSEKEGYSDENIKINLTETTVNDTAVYIAEVSLSSAEYLKTAFARDSYGKNVTDSTSSIAENNEALLAINGDYYGARESGYVIRNGVIYRDTSKEDTDILCIYADGTMQIKNTGEVSAQELIDQGVWQVLSFGPVLVEEGQIATKSGQEVGRAMASNPRTAIGITSDGHYLFVVSDGRTDESEGLSINELASLMKSLGAVTAYNLDGGGSSTMYYMGEVINNPTTNGNNIKERSVSDIVYIGK